MDFIVEPQDFGMELKNNCDKTVAVLERIPGMKRVPFGNEYIAYAVETILASDKENLREILESMKNFCIERNIAIVYHLYSSKGYKLSKVTETKKVYMELGFQLNNSSLWFIP